MIRRIIIKNGMVVDPKNNINAIRDIAMEDDRIVEVKEKIQAEKEDKIINAKGLLVVPGLIDMHLHLGDLFEVSTQPIKHAAENGVCLGLSPGAGNTLMAPALLGAEMDRGVPLNIGVFLGAAGVLGTKMNVEDLIMFFQGGECLGLKEKMTGNNITNRTARYIIGIKEHMGHYMMPDESIEKIFRITERGNLVFMSHTQDPSHTEKLLQLAKGRNVHLAHVTAAGCGTHADPVDGMKRVLNLIDDKTVTGEFVTSMLREKLGNREGLRMTKAAQELSFEALSAKKVKILVSDGQSQSTMKGFGDTSDNIAAILELAEKDVLSLSDSVATMTCNPARLIAERTNNQWWEMEVGHLGAGAYANITIIDPESKRAVYTIVNGQVVSFEGKLIRENYGAGMWVSKFLPVKNMMVGEISMYETVGQG